MPHPLLAPHCNKLDSMTLAVKVEFDFSHCLARQRTHHLMGFSSDIFRPSLALRSGGENRKYMKLYEYFDLI